MFYSSICTDSSSFYNVSPLRIALVYVLLIDASLIRFISCNSDNCVHTVIIIGNACILWQHNVLNVFLRRL